ncbi:MAG TPA: hypothetical protein VNT20_20390 [Flavisolibacter sp.]|jgi:hypothetical protein|nr:hypothetical protein [Flavisolibacter sp.]
MKWFFIFCLLFFFYSCSNNTKTTAADNDTSVHISDKIKDSVLNNTNTSDTSQLIVPGERIGKVKLNEEVSSLEILGPPDISDAAMGKAWLTWKGHRDEHNNTTELNVYTTYKDNTMREKTVQQIRTTSPSFSTGNNLHMYSSLEEIQQQFPLLKKTASYKEEGRDILLYDAAEKGIAFEIATVDNQQICIGIIVHEPGKDVTQIYIMRHPGMKKSSAVLFTPLWKDQTHFYC